MFILVSLKLIWGRSQVHQTGTLLTLHVYTDYIKAYMGNSQVPIVHQTGTLLTLQVYIGYRKVNTGKITGPSEWFTLNSTCLY